MLFPLMTVALLFHKFHIYTILKPSNSLETTVQLKKGHQYSTVAEENFKQKNIQYNILHWRAPDSDSWEPNLEWAAANDPSTFLPGGGEQPAREEFSELLTPGQLLCHKTRHRHRQQSLLVWTRYKIQVDFNLGHSSSLARKKSFEARK